MTRLRALAASVLLLVALSAIGAWVLLASPSQAQSDQSVLASLISRVLSTPTTRVSIGAVEGALTSNAVIRDIRISDRDGVWLSVDRARLVWTRTALLRGRLQVDTLTVDGLRYLRPSEPAEEGAPVADGPILPEVPVEVVVREFALNEFTLGEPVLGTAARLSATGSARLGDPSEGLNLNFRAERQDAPGRFAVDLDYVPQTNRLKVALDLNEPAGGLTARLLDLPGLPPVRLSVNGEGPLADWAAQLAFDAGAGIGAEGRATIRREADAYQSNVDLAARISGLLPAPVAPVFSGTTRLTGGVAVQDGGGVRLQQLRLASEVAALDVSGNVGSDGALDIGLTAKALPTSDGKTRAGLAEIGRLALDAKVQGTLTAPRLNGTLEAAAVRLPQGSLDRLDARISSAPVGDAATADRFSFNLDTKTIGFRPTDQALARAIGPTIAIVARGVIGTDGAADVETARIETTTATAQFTGRVGTTTLDGRLTAELPALAPFSDLAGRRLDGSARLNAELDGDPGRSMINALIDARLSDFRSGDQLLDGLLGRQVTATGRVSRVPRGFTVENFRLDGAQLDVRVDGRATEEAADLRLDLAIAELKALDPRISAGRARADARLTGSLKQPNLAMTARIEDARALGRPIPRLALQIDATDLTGRLDAQVKLDGNVAGKPARGSLRLQRPAEGGYQLDPLDVRIGSVALTGAVQTGDAGLAKGRLSLDAQNLDDLSPLVLTKLDGRAKAVVDLAIQDGGQRIAVDASGARLAFGTVAVRDFTSAITVDDAFKRPVVDGVIEAQELTAGGQTFSRVRLTADGTPQASAFALTASARGFDLDARGRVVPGPPTRIDLASFEARRGGRRIALAQPAALTLRDGGVTIANLVIAADRGRISVSGTAGQNLDLTVEVRSLPLSVAEIFVPNLGIAGTANATARIQGTTASPSGSYTIRLDDLTAPQIRDAGLPPLDIAAEGRVADERATVAATIDAARFGTLRVNGSVPVDPAGRLDLAVTGRVDLAPVNAQLGEGRRLTGSANIDLKVAGSLTEPRLEGTASLANGTFTDQLQGITLTGIDARLAGRGDVITIERLTATTPQGGTVGASGRITIDPAAGFPADIRLTGNRAQLVSNALVTTTANLDLSVTGPVLRSPTVSGRVDILTLDVSIPERLPTTLRPLPNTKHIAPPPTAAARLVLARKREARTRSGRAPFDARLDLQINALNRIFVRGRGLQAELGGSLRLTGTSQEPVAVGAFDLRRGRFDILGQRLDLVRGQLAFTGDLTPSIDFLAETQAEDVTARIAVTGIASQPEFSLSSNPDLPQDEILSRILFRKASGGLSAGQALQLAQAVAQLSGNGGGGAFEALRRSLGVDSLDFTTGTRGGVAVGASRYISDNVRVGVKAGARPEESGLSVDIDITRRLKLQGEVGATGNSSIGAGFEWEY